MGVPYAELIGDPVAHSKSPLIHKYWLEQLGIEGDYRATRVTAAELPDYLANRRGDPDWRGCNVTMPLKEAAFALVDANGPARRIGAVNTIIRHEQLLIGVNTDGQGLSLAVDMAGLRPKRVAMIGAGGAARAALEEMRLFRVDEVLLLNRSPEKAAALLDLFELQGEVLPPGAAPAADLLINASPLGMAGHPALDVDLSRLAAGATVIDMVYHPLDTPLLQAARARGLKAVDGLTMLIHQAAMAFACFFKDRPTQPDTAELRGRLTS